MLQRMDSAAVDCLFDIVLLLLLLLHISYWFEAAAG
jgi:hypothetical protein